MKRLPLLLSLVSGLLLWAAWPTSPLTFLIFIAFVPLLRMMDVAKGYHFGLLFLAFWIWNTGATWWVGNTPVPASGIFANAFNALLMTFPWIGYRAAQQRLDRRTAYFALVVYWLTFEYIHQEWELSWPWMMLGNVFAMRPNWVQWYEFTGVMGGSVWVLLANITLFEIWRKRDVRAKITAAACLLLPFVLSFLVRPSIADGPRMQVVVVQPNIDPYEEKFSEGSSQQQLQKLLALTQQQIDTATAYVIWPETALFTEGAWEHTLNDRPEIIKIRQFLRQYPRTKLITGASTYRQYIGTETVTATARTRRDGGPPYDAFNSALQIDTSLQIQIYHKAKLVPGVEITPYMRFLPFMKKLALDMGGITGSYGLTPGVPLFNDLERDCSVFSAICYESVFGNFVAEKVRAGANLLVVSTNDGWWGNTEGHRQHCQYARLRAIETRRWVARSANTGISCFVNPLGELIDPQPYWQPASIKHAVTKAANMTFYVKYGGYASKAPLIFCILLLSYTIVLRVIRRKNVEIK